MSARSYSKHDRTVTVDTQPGSVRVTASDSGGNLSLPVRIVTGRPDDYAKAIRDDLAASGYTGSGS
jgi:hypothetical protein